MKLIPNLFTLLNLIFGCLAIVSSLQNGISIQYSEEGAQLIDVSEKIWLASLFIGLAAVVDFMDGFIARLFNATSALGKQLDSLADVVSFGVAPSMIIYQFLRMSFAKEEGGLAVSAWWLAPAFFIAAAAAYRLAIYNLDSRQQSGFRGVPTPAVGLLVASFPLIYWHSGSVAVNELLFSRWFLYSIVLILCWLMVSRIPMLALKFKNRNLSGNLPLIILPAVAIISSLFLGWYTVPLVFTVYILLSLIFKQNLG